MHAMFSNMTEDRRSAYVTCRASRTVCVLYTTQGYGYYVHRRLQLQASSAQGARAASPAPLHISRSDATPGAGDWPLT